MHIIKSALSCFLKRSQWVVLSCALCLVLCGCYNKGQLSPDAWDLTAQQLDSISFYTTHHYTQNYNFLVRADSLMLIEQHPVEMLSEMPVDTIVIYKGNPIVVADITTIPADTIDSVWVKVARDQLTFGWIHEHDMLKGVSPDDPISQFIDFFSNKHLLIFLAFLVVVCASYGLRKLLRLGSKLVHFNDIPSFYPTLLCLLIAMSATLYSSIQMFGAESWRHFYYHPTLNPYAVPAHLSLFLISVWAIIIVALTCVMETRRLLPVGQALIYLLGLAAVCAVVYVVFSVSTLYYIGYPLLIAYVVFALRRYFRFARAHFRCGNCGMKLHAKGVCPHCGAVNT